DTQPGALEIGLNHTVPRLLGQFMQPTMPRNASVVEGEIQSPPYAEGLAHEPLDPSRSADVALHEDRLAAILLDGVEGLLPSFDVDVGEHDPGALGREGYGAGAAQPTACARNDRHFVVKLSRPSLLRLLCRCSLRAPWLGGDHRWSFPPRPKPAEKG